LVDRPNAKSLKDPCIRMMDRVRHRLEPFPPILRTTRDDSDIGSNIEILVELLIRSDVLVQIALFQLLLEERFVVPVVIPYNEDFNDFRHLLEPLKFVQVKVGNQETHSIAKNTSLPRVVFVSNRQTIECRESVEMASEVMNCEFSSVDIKSGVKGGPTILELGVGFLKSSTKSPEKHMPCLTFCVSGDHNKLGMILEKVADIVIIEMDPNTKPVSPSWVGTKTTIIFWNIDSSRQVEDTSVGHIWGKFSNVSKSITQHVLGTKIFKERNGEALSLAEGFCLLYPLHRPTPISNIEKLEAIDFDGVRMSLHLQKLYTKEAKYYFKSLRKRERSVELQQKMKGCKENRKRASGASHELPIIQLFIQLLSQKKHVERNLGILHLQLFIDQKLQRTLELASKKVIDAHNELQKDQRDAELKGNYQHAMNEHVNQMLGLEHLWRELGHIFAADPKNQSNLPKLAMQHLLDGFPLEILDGDATIFHKEWWIQY
jgi:hypothetical protein